MEKFNFDTIENFDEHINKSIPNYDILINSILSISEYFIERDTNVYDIGCSTGNLLRALDNKENINKIGIDKAKIMPQKNDLSKNIFYINTDLNKSKFDFINSSLTMSIFTLQFLKKPIRQKIINNVYDGLNDGGAFIMCEKIYQENGLIQEIMSFSHYDYKCKNFTEQEIIKKERDLRYIMKPNTLNKNIVLLKNAGFKKISTFWQCFNFIGLIAIK
jgi:tRNA (cmo5U34)-methyltransferase